VTLTDHGITSEGTLGKPETTSANAFRFTTPAVATPATVTQVPDASPVHYFLKVAGVTGDSTDKDHKGWFEIDGFDFGVTQSGGAATGSGAGAGKVAFSPLTVEGHDGENLSAETFKPARRAGGRAGADFVPAKSRPGAL
jgi:hypothetical protein